jgi:hypothetical protein
MHSRLEVAEIARPFFNHKTYDHECMLKWRTVRVLSRQVQFLEQPCSIDVCWRLLLLPCLTLKAIISGTPKAKIAYLALCDAVNTHWPTRCGPWLGIEIAWMLGTLNHALTWQ